MTKNEKKTNEHAERTKVER